MDNQPIILQSIINRLAITSVILKAAVLVFAAVLISGCFINADNSHFHVAAVMIVVVWALDAYYLKTERGFRKTFMHAEDPDYAIIKNSELTPQPTSFHSAMFSKTMLCYYVPLLVLTGIEFLMH